MYQITYTPNDTMGVDDSQSIQNAVDMAAKTGVMHVTIPRYNARTESCEWVITKEIRLPSKMTVILENCYITMADDVVSNVFVSENAYTEDAFDPEKRMYGITIQGVGNAVLDGGKPTELCEGNSLQDGRPHISRNHPIFMINVEGFKVENISITNQRYWGMRFEFCSKGIIRDIFTNVIRDRNNQDGINLRNGCHDILIENVHGQTGDDMIALSAIDTEKADSPGNMIVRGLSHDIHDVVIRNISGAAITHPLIALRNHNGAKIYNITIENVSDTPQLQPSLKHDNYERYGIIRIGNNAYYHFYPSQMGDTYNIKINNVNINYSARGIVTQATLKDCKISNVHAGGTCRSIVAVTPASWAGASGGVKMENVTVDGVIFEAASRENSAVFDFSVMREEDYVHGLKLQNAQLRNVGKVVDLDPASTKCEVAMQNVSWKI